MTVTQLTNRIRLLAGSVVGILLFNGNYANAQQGQQGQNSELIVTYDFATPESKTEIPFDKYFTLQILHFNTEQIQEIRVYEAMFYNGRRILKRDVKKGNINTPVIDFIVEKDERKVKHDTLLLYFPPIKPDKEFEIAVIRGLTKNNLVTAMNLNEAIFNNSPDAPDYFKQLHKGVIDDALNLIVLKTNSLALYKDKFKYKFEPYYKKLKAPANFPSAPFLSIGDLNVMNEGFTQTDMKFKWGHIPARLINDDKIDDMFAGYLPADYDSATKPAGAIDFKGRVNNLSKSIASMDTIYRYLNTYISINDKPAFRCMLLIIENAIKRLRANKEFINTESTALTNAIQTDTDLEEIEVVVGGTKAKDIKTQGSNIFTLDLGLATIGSWNSRNQFAALPKLYYGVNIYFRPINKNTRRENIPTGLPANPIEGPDYNIVAQRSIWQHLSLTIGLTTGGYRNTEFDNLYNNTTLLIGGGYRFYRAFKVTAGAAFLRRASNNPVITDKGVFVGPFVSFSADIDLVQTIKDIINPLWK